jgi:hypothetical protein
LNAIDIYKLSGEDQVGGAIDAILTSLELLLDSITILIKSNALNAYLLTEASSELCRVVFKFYCTAKEKSDMNKE